MGTGKEESHFGKWDCKVYGDNDSQTFSEVMEQSMQRIWANFLKCMFLILQFPLANVIQSVSSKLLYFENTETASCVWSTTHPSSSKQVNELSRF